MKIRIGLVRALSLVLFGACGLLFGSAQATSTDGYHKLLVVPVVVKSGSFVTSFFIHNPDAGSSVTVRIIFHRGVDYTGVSPSPQPSVNCGDYVVGPGRVVSFADLSAICPGAPAGSVYGWLSAAEITPNTTLPFALFTRVDNVQFTAGFEIESYPAHTFTGANVYVTGLKRSIGPGGTGTPFQTNCFVSALAEPTEVTLTLLNGATGSIVANTSPITVALPANQLIRILDIFSSGGNYTNAMLKVTTTGIGTTPPLTYPGAIVFCTVQNNIVFDGDFRIAKASPVRDNHVQRLWVENVDAAGSLFQIGTHPNERSRHVVYFKHPDVVECAISGSGLEMRLYDPEDNLVAGGAGVTAFTNVYTGDKGQHGNPNLLFGANGKWRIDVQAVGALTPPNTQYTIACRSGSGHGGYEWIGRNLPHTP